MWISSQLWRQTKFVRQTVVSPSHCRHKLAPYCLLLRPLRITVASHLRGSKCPHSPLTSEWPLSPLISEDCNLPSHLWGLQSPLSLWGLQSPLSSLRIPISPFIFEDCNLPFHNWGLRLPPSLRITVVIMVDESKIDISREFTCFLSNGMMTILGSIELESSFVRLTTPE